MERVVALQVITECANKINALLHASEVGGGQVMDRITPKESLQYSPRELLDLLPAIEAEAFEIGKSVSRLRKRLCEQLGIPTETKS